MNDRQVPSPEKLEALSTASDEMMQSIFVRDREGTLRTVVSNVHKLLEAESCAIFLVPDDNRKKLILETAYTDKWSTSFQSVSLDIKSELGQGLTGHLAAKGELIELHGNDLKHNEYVAGKRPEHLMSDQCFSLLAVPLKDRKDRLIGLLKVENKKGKDGNPADELFFTEEDKSIAKILANKIRIVLETLHTSLILRGLTAKMHAAQSISDVFQTCLQEAVRLLRADRGDLARWDEVKRDLIVEYTYGEGGVAQGDVLPKRSLIRQVWNNGQPRLVSRVSAEPGYHHGNAKTQSEVVVRLEWEDQHIGVLNIESFQPQGLDDQDIEMLQLLGQSAVLSYRAIGKEAHFRGIIEGLGQTSPPQRFLRRILETVRGIYGFDGGVIYIADYTQQKLWCEAFISSKTLDIKNARDFSYDFGERSLSTEVFQQRLAQFEADPRSSKMVNPRGLEAFQVEGPLLGVPLIFSEKVLGVLVVWSSQKQKSPTEEHISDLKPFAQLAAAAIAISETDTQRGSVLQAIEDILRQMQSRFRKEDLVRSILESVHSAGFDRARIFEYGDHPAQFTVVDSMGMSNPTNLQGRTVYIDRNLYAKHTKETALLNPSARIYDPSGSDPNMPNGPDPDASTFEKPEDLTWAAVPLVVAGALYGQMTADNAISRRPITSEMLEYLTLLGALAAHVIESAQTNRTVHALTSPLTFGPADHELTTVKRVLVFLTASEMVGFSRALFFEFEDDKQRLRYYAGLGRDALEQFAEDTPDAGITSIFDRAAKISDESLDAKMEGFEIDVQELTAKTLLEGSNVDEFSPANITSWPEWMRNLAERLESHHFLVVSVRTEKKLFGLLFVDRHPEQPLGEADKAALATSAHLAALLLRQHRLQRFINPTVAEAASSFLRLQPRTVTICFWDIRGFTDLCEKLKSEPTLISGFLKDYYNTATEIIETKYAGIVDKFIGDGVMALFGVAAKRTQDDGANPAVCAALDMRRQFAEVVNKWKDRWARAITVAVPEIKLGCGINTGNVLVGNVGTQSRDQFTALGPHVNFASRIQDLCTTGEILISQPTKIRLDSRIPSREFKTIKNIPGIPGKHPLHAVEPHANCADQLDES